MKKDIVKWKFVQNTVQFPPQSAYCLLLPKFITLFLGYTEITFGYFNIIVLCLSWELKQLFNYMSFSFCMWLYVLQKSTKPWQIMSINRIEIQTELP